MILIISNLARVGLTRAVQGACYAVHLTLLECMVFHAGMV